MLLSAYVVALMTFDSREAYTHNPGFANQVALNSCPQK
jgi:hypothetical protein